MDITRTIETATPADRVFPGYGALLADPGYVRA